jgi:serine/threonine protein kinase
MILLTISSIDDTVIDLLDRLLSWNPDRRLSAEETLEHPYFRTEPLPCEPEK